MDPVPTPDPGPADRAALGKLRWRCRRGMRELDELLTRYVDEQYATAPAAQQAAFRELLDTEETLLYAWFLGRATPPDPVLAGVIDRIAAGPAND